MTREEAANILSNDIIDGHVEGNARFMDAFWFAVDNLKAEPCEDAVSREFMYKLGAKCIAVRTENDELVALASIESLPSVTPKPETVTEFADRCRECGVKYGKLIKQELCEQFVKWVATEIFDDMWEYNKDAFAEIACRKLAKLGIVRAKGDEWVLVNEEGESE